LFGGGMKKLTIKTTILLTCIFVNFVQVRKKSSWGEVKPSKPAQYGRDVGTKEHREHIREENQVDLKKKKYHHHHTKASFEQN